ncbi:MAG: hypothetical protein HZA54_10260 [Planctomycetes bacterium]|nr:hypothetical protein [Planctomycetota bacterium]
MPVTCITPERSSLLSFFLQSLLGRKAATPAGARALAGFDRRILVRAGEMQVTLACRDGAIEIHPGAVLPWDASVGGDLATMLGLGLGHNFLLPLLTGRLSFSGNPLPLLTLLRLFGAPDPAPSPAAATATAAPSLPTPPSLSPKA